MIHIVHQQVHLVGVYQDNNMEKKELDIIKQQLVNLKNLPNSKLLDYMERLSTDFEEKKSQIINLTLELDNVELLYNNILKEYQNRNK